MLGEVEVLLQGSSVGDDLGVSLQGKSAHEFLVCARSALNECERTIVYVGMVGID